MKWQQALEGGEEGGSMDRLMERQTEWIHGGPDGSRPSGAVGIAVMLMDVWQIASAFTVNTKQQKQ